MKGVQKKEKQITWREDIKMDFQVGPILLAIAIIIREFTTLEAWAMSAGLGWGMITIFLVSTAGAGGMIAIGTGLYKLIKHRRHLDEVKVKKNKVDKQR